MTSGRVIIPRVSSWRHMAGAAHFSFPRRLGGQFSQQDVTRSGQADIPSGLIQSAGRNQASDASLLTTEWPKFMYAVRLSIE